MKRNADTEAYQAPWLGRNIFSVLLVVLSIMGILTGYLMFNGGIN